MSSNSSNTPKQGGVIAQVVAPPPLPGAAPATPTEPKQPLLKRTAMLIGVPVWVFAGFMTAQALFIAVLTALSEIGVTFDGLSNAVFNSVAGVIIYALALFVVIGLPWFIRHIPTTKEELGIAKAPQARDIFLTPVVFLVYLISTAIVSSFALQLLPFVDATEQQDTGFVGISGQFEYVLAFLSLVIIAPIAEELLFRGYLLGKLRKYVSLWLAIFVTSLLFAIVHFQWNVGIDVFVLSIFLCLLRVWTNSLWSPILLHMLKNGIAYYFLFINPSLLSTLGG